jgi:hypothetical protein
LQSVFHCMLLEVYRLHCQKRAIIFGFKSSLNSIN